MKRIIPLIVISLLTSFAYSQGGLNFQWAKQIPGVNYNPGEKVEIAPDGSIRMSGSLTGTCDVDPGTGVVNLTAVGDVDPYLIKLDASGNFVWAAQFGSQYSEVIYDLVVDDQGNTYAVGSFGHQVDFDPGPGQHIVDAGGSIAGFIVKLNPNGQFLWVQTIISSINESYGVCLDDAGHVYMTGRFTGTVDFDPGPGAASFTSNASNDGFVVRYNTNGTFQWCKVIAGNSAEKTNKIFYKKGELGITGAFNGTTDFDPGTGTSSITPADPGNHYDAFFMKLDTSGQFLWVVPLQGVLNKDVSGIALDNDGNVYITGSFNGTVDFDPSAGTHEFTNSNIRQMYTAKYSTSGQLLFAHRLGNSGVSSGGSALRLDENNNIYTTGFFTGLNVDFDPGPGTHTLSVAGNMPGQYEIFIYKLDSAANYVWATSCPGPNDFQAGFDLALGSGPDNEIVVVGSFHGTTDFDPGVNTFNLTAISSFQDAFIMKLGKETQMSLTDNQLQDLLLYPNPADGQITIVHSSGSDKVFTVYDPLGRLVMEQKIEAKSSETTMQLTLSSGFYRYRISDLNGDVSGSFIVK